MEKVTEECDSTALYEMKLQRKVICYKNDKTYLSQTVSDSRHCRLLDQVCGFILHMWLFVIGQNELNEPGSVLQNVTGSLCFMIELFFPFFQI